MKDDEPRRCPDCGSVAVKLVDKFTQGGLPARRLRCRCGTSWVQQKVPE